jgi:hypothetical protein
MAACWASTELIHDARLARWRRDCDPPDAGGAAEASGEEVGSADASADGCVAEEEGGEVGEAGVASPEDTDDVPVGRMVGGTASSGLRSESRSRQSKAAEAAWKVASE